MGAQEKDVLLYKIRCWACVCVLVGCTFVKHSGPGFSRFGGVDNINKQNTGEIVGVHKRICESCGVVGCTMKYSFRVFCLGKFSFIFFGLNLFQQKKRVLCLC